MRNNSKLTIWVEALGVFDFLSLFINTFFSGAHIRYDEKNISTACACLINILQRCKLCKNFYMAKLILGKKDTKGYALNYRKEDDLDICFNRFCQKYIPEETERFKNAVKLYLNFYLEHRVTFITMVEASDEFKQPDRKNAIYLARHPLNSIIKQYYKDKGCLLRESGLFLEQLKYFSKPLYRIFYFTALKFSRKEVKTNIIEPKPSVWIEYFHKGISNSSFYYNAIDRNKFDIVCYLDRNDGVSLNEEVKVIEQMQLKWIDLRSGSLARLANISVGRIMGMISGIFCGYPGLPLWFKVFWFEFRMFYLLYKAVFARFKVKILIQHQELSWVQEPQMRALEDTGGIMLGYHWSNFIFYKQAGFANPQHVYFVWGKMMYECLQKKGNISRHVLPAGMWFGPVDEGSEDIRMRDNLKFVIAIFDSSVAYNIHQSEDSLDKFYLKLLDMLERNPGWGGIVKSKNWNRINDLEFLPHGKEIVSRGILLAQEKRLVFLNRSISPVIASARADLSACYGINSAGIVSGIYGHRAIHWDLSGLHYPIYKDPDQRVVFHDLKEFSVALLKAGAGDKQIGDFSKWRKPFNYFDDFNGRARISGFIRSFMEEVSICNDPLKSLDAAVDTYVKTNNIEDKFFKTNGLWEDA